MSCAFQADAFQQDAFLVCSAVTVEEQGGYFRRRGYRFVATAEPRSRIERDDELTLIL